MGSDRLPCGAAFLENGRVLADDLELRRPVAIKLLTSEELSDDEDARLWRITSIWINDTEHTASTYLASIEGYPEEIGPFQFEVYDPDYP